MPTDYAAIAAKHGGVPDNLGKQDPGLTAQTQLSLEQAPYALRKWIDIPKVKAYRSPEPVGGADAAGGVPPIAGVNAGDTNAIHVYRPNAYTTDPSGVKSNQLPVHESDHLAQNIMDKMQSSQFPPEDKTAPYKDMQLTADNLVNLRKVGDTLWKHSREGQASILQTYQARKDWLLNKATPQQKRDYMLSIGEFAGDGHAQFEQAYGPYLNDLATANMPKGAYNASVQQTPMKSPALLLPKVQ